ncbi:general stress protein 13 [Oceanobacillus oncorhynchi subsp. incaldanensis]|uniref:General stress protein 13 n=1 Tax=Oceanobacillus oncorhynchi TaxID=545501 RepID=A0A0A1M867_9BACI|nr:S1 domain-containing post-transcriptional regulator GSP13 [Oceanobacillus oncorhynchi]UUI38956.1 S1 domain-containing post-transcriptional regulator GSP13 [Oceanobacillus oncorhynchi]GIO21172.1 general stress protein 13 [Oceanobacillus oncorhynchi subsp. incaldanensis]CEI81505.1 General stress protein 13 [Oceanobacillus oncorhynchi]
MTANVEIGQVIEGKVTGIQPYGAFVAIDGDTQGLVHISEIMHGYVKDINEHLNVGDTVNVKVIQIDEEKGKISLSIRATEEAPKETVKQENTANNYDSNNDSSGFNILKDKLQDWIDQTQNK